MSSKLIISLTQTKFIVALLLLFLKKFLKIIFSLKDLKFIDLIENSLNLDDY
jgi:hypothetical protein